MSCRAEIEWVSGPVLRARGAGFALREAVAVGPQALLGEAVRLEGERLWVQVYEDTTGLRPGMQVLGSGLPLSVPLGPHLLGGMYDGLLRPLGGTEQAFVQPGLAKPAHGWTGRWQPLVEVGSTLSPGQALGRWEGAAGGIELALLVPDGMAGTLRQISPAAVVDAHTQLALIEGEDGRSHVLRATEVWPVRKPRPIRRRLPTRAPLITGQRILDALFPVALGGKAAIPGGFGTGKTVLLEALARGCSADVIVYLGCGERGNEIAGVLEEFPTLSDPRNGQPLMARTVIIANTSNMPVAAREASIYSAVTVAEYFRDQGLHVALMADSTSRWAEALREVSGRFGELPGEGGYPAYLASRLADFYERAALVETLNGRQGSVTLIGAISPPSGDFSEPVTSHTKRYVKAFWTLDVKRAQARFYPAVHPLQSYAEDAETFAPWWAAQGNDAWWSLRKRFLAMLEEQARLERMARIIGKDALPPRQQLSLASAELINDAFLRQSAFSTVDRVASPAKQAEMMRLVALWIDLAEATLAAGQTLAAILALPCTRALMRMGEDIGDEPARYAALKARVQTEFSSLQGSEHAPAAAR